MNENGDLVDGSWHSLPLSRRTLLRGSLLGGAGLAAAALIGCGDDDDDDDDDDDSAAAVAPTDAAPAGGDAAGDAAAGSGVGKLVRDESLPYPYNFEDPAGTPKAGGVMKVAATWNFQTIDPVTSAAGGTVTIPNNVYDRLLRISRGPDADVFQPGLEPELAESWERSPDGLAFTFHIRPGITWQNLEPLSGRPFVAEDARFALERYATEGVHKAYYTNASAFEAIDDATLKITMANPTADFLNPLGSNKQTIFPRELVDDGTIETKAIGTGAMILRDAIASQSVTFDKNPDYWEREVLLDGFEYRIMPDLVARTAAFRVGQIDYAYSLVSSLLELDKILDTNPDVQVNLVPVTANGATLGMNLTLAKYQDERVRQAISLAINREEITDIVTDGLAKSLAVIPWTYVLDEEPTIESGLLGKWLRHDPAEAMKLLQAAGAEGLELDNSYYPYSSEYATRTDVIQAQLKDVGINMTGGKVDYTEFNSQWVPQKLPDASTSAWATSGFDADNWFHGQIHSQSPGNRWRINDAEIDEWAVAQQLELDPDARKEIWQKIWDKDLDQMWRIPLSTGPAFHVYHPWVRGLRFTGAAPGDNSHYYSIGSQLSHAWLDK